MKSIDVEDVKYNAQRKRRKALFQKLKRIG